MKKLLLIALVSFLSISLYSCSKNKTLDKTSWTYQNEEGKYVLKFITKTDMSLTAFEDGETFGLAGTYTYDAPNVTITIQDEPAQGVVDGNKLTLTDPDDGTIIVFTKN